MTFHNFVLAIRKNWIVIVVLGVLGALAGLIYATAQPDTYRAQSSVVIVPARGDSTSELVQGSNYVSGLVATYTVVATSPVVLDRVIADLDLDTSAQALSKSISVESPLDTAVLQISVTGSDAAAVTRIANSVAEELATAVEGLSPQTTASGPAVRVELIKSATEPRVPIAPNTRLLIALGALTGLAAGFVFAIARRLLATRVASRADIAEITDVPVLGEIYSAKGASSVPAAIRASSTGSVAESVRGIAAALRFANLDGEKRVILVTSPEAGEGKSSVSMSLALVIAEQGNRVLVIDADLRRGSIAALTGLEQGVGLTTTLLGDVTPEQAIQTWGVENLNVMTSGQTPPNPGQILASDQVHRLLSAARDDFDVVIVDSPPVLAVSDALWLAPAVDGIIVVARYRRTRRDALVQTLADLEATRTRILGIVLNDARRVNTSPYYDHAESSPSSRRRPRRVARS